MQSLNFKLRFTCIQKIHILSVPLSVPSYLIYHYYYEYDIYSLLEKTLANKVFFFLINILKLK